MRLLHTTKLVFEDFFDSNIPRYAILSHRWTTDEVSFEELIAGTKTTAGGYRKIQKCCQLAASENNEWVWIDTCCIDKNSSAALSEAINSMYRWYQTSRVCYAYLSDVHVSKPASDSVDNLKSWEESFRKSSWFTRGWTLQELIAPGEIKFFDRHWTNIGTRASLAPLIADITKIALRVIESPFRIHEYTVAQKLSRAANRSCSRVEDTAYCLLGILDINMPLLYGEGIKAFARLQEEIIRTSDDESIFAWNHRSHATSGRLKLLADSPRYFVNCGDVRSRDFYKRRSYAITNRGLHMTVPLLQYRHETSTKYLPLNCTRDGKSPMGLCLSSQPDSDFDTRFKRVRCVDLKVAGFGATTLSTLADREAVDVEIEVRPSH